MAHCQCELIQAVWKYLLDDNFIHAMKYGVVVVCHDGVSHQIYHVYLLILLITQRSEASLFRDCPFNLSLTKSRVLLATIRDNGLCPRPRCLMPKTHLDQMGWVPDSNFRLSGIRWYLYKKVQAAQDLIYRLCHAVAGAGVNGLLKLTSSVPTIVRDFFSSTSIVLTCST